MTAAKADALVLLPGEMMSPPDARSPGFAETSGLPGEMMSLTHSFFLRASPQVSRCQVLISTGLTLVCTEWEMFIQQKVCSGSEPFALFLLILIANYSSSSEDYLRLEFG